MKKRFLSFVLVLAMLAVLSLPAFARTNTVTSDEIVASLSTQQPSRASRSVLEQSEPTETYLTDTEGNIYGPEDFVVSGNNVYVLDSIHNSIAIYDSTGLYDTILLDSDDLYAIKIAVDGSTIYALGSNLDVVTVSDETEQLINLRDYNIDEAITDFKVYSGKLYIGVAEQMGGASYVFDLSDPDTVSVQRYNGYFFDQNTLAASQIISEDDSLFGHQIRLTLTNLVSNTARTITLESDFWLAGAQYLGTNSDGNYMVKVNEIATSADYTLDVSETLQELSTSGTQLSVRQIPQQHKETSNQFKNFNGEIYQLDTTSENAAVVRLGNDKLLAAASYVSPLSATVEPLCETQSSVAPASINSTISRATIMSNAASYHSSFSWTCSATNIASMTGYTKPRCISGAGSYTMMPYCWGGFSSPSQFKSGLTAGGRAGNINTSASGYVSNTYGVDCSGYVSRCWGTSDKYGTATIGNISSEITYSALKKGDALLTSGHIILFEQLDGTNTYVVYEATMRNSYDRVAHTTYSLSTLQNNGYVAIRYDNVSG